ncbi:MAG: hypothetical protein Ta2B_18500 [Termitinemataceae bacterium]|nr:MAG: hypothetical protein Ta2B_18500 [Termitinemataceae bacterium]
MFVDKAKTCKIKAARFHAQLLVIILICGIIIISCTPKKKKEHSARDETYITSPKNDVPVWLTSQVNIPRYAIDEAVQYRSLFLSENSESASDLIFDFYYDKIGDACLEATVTGKNNYIWEQPTWICMRWSEGSGEVGIGEIKYKRIKKESDEAEYRIEERRKDPAFAEIEKTVLKLATDYDYDFMSAYGIKVNYRTSNVKKAFCEGYSNATEQAFRKHPLIDHVESYSGGNHEWNTIVLKDGRKLYADVTWYDGNTIDDEGYVVHTPDRNPVNLTFDLNEFNSLGGAIDESTGRPVKVHFDFKDVKRVD